MNKFDRPTFAGLSTAVIPGVCSYERADSTSGSESQVYHLFGRSRCIRMMLAPGTLL
jgi:hypothetical protein